MINTIMKNVINNPFRIRHLCKVPGFLGTRVLSLNN